MILNPKPGSGWIPFFQQECAKPYYQKLNDALRDLRNAGGCICPQPDHVFRSFQICPWEKIRVIILGQDPYANPDLANGLSFSVPGQQRIPPSLRNIFTELSRDLRMAPPRHGDLEPWGKQGVLLLNASLTVSCGKPHSHKDLGWHLFTDSLVQWLSLKRNHLVFILWGQDAQNKASLVDETKHLVLKAAHPSPLSAHRGFWDSKPFSRTNQWLLDHGLSPIHWNLEYDFNERP